MFKLSESLSEFLFILTSFKVVTREKREKFGYFLITFGFQSFLMNFSTISNWSTRSISNRLNLTRFEIEIEYLDIKIYRLKSNYLDIKIVISMPLTLSISTSRIIPWHDPVVIGQTLCGEKREWFLKKKANKLRRLRSI